MLALSTTACYPKFQLRAYTEIGDDGWVSRSLTYSGDTIPPIKLPADPPWKLEQKPEFLKITGLFRNSADLKTDFAFPKSYPDEKTFTGNDRELLADLRIKEFTPETFFSRNAISITRRNWVFFTVYRYNESFENRKVIEMLRKLEGIDSYKFKILGKDDNLERILANFQFVYEVKMPGSLIKTSSNNINGDYCSWSFTMADFYWGYREYKLKATSIKTNIVAIIIFAFSVIAFVFGLFYIRNRR